MLSSQWYLSHLSSPQILHIQSQNSYEAYRDEGDVTHHAFIFRSKTSSLRHSLLYFSAVPTKTYKCSRIRCLLWLFGDDADIDVEWFSRGYFVSCRRPLGMPGALPTATIQPVWQGSTGSTLQQTAKRSRARRPYLIHQLLVLDSQSQSKRSSKVMSAIRKLTHAWTND